MQFLWTTFSVLIRIWIMCFFIKGIHEKYSLGPLRWFFTNPIQGRVFKSYGGSKGGLKPCTTSLIWKKIIKVEMWSIGFIRNVISPCYHQNFNLFKWQVRRNNPIEFQWYADIIRMITQIFTTPQKFWSLDQPLHPVP